MVRPHLAWVIIDPHHLRASGAPFYVTRKAPDRWSLDFDGRRIGDFSNPSMAMFVASNVFAIFNVDRHELPVPIDSDDGRGDVEPYAPIGTTDDGWSFDDDDGNAWAKGEYIITYSQDAGAVIYRKVSVPGDNVSVQVVAHNETVEGAKRWADEDAELGDRPRSITAAFDEKGIQRAAATGSAEETLTGVERLVASAEELDKEFTCGCGKLHCKGSFFHPPECRCVHCCSYKARQH